MLEKVLQAGGPDAEGNLVLGLGSGHSARPRAGAEGRGRAGPRTMPSPCLLVGSGMGEW